MKNDLCGHRFGKLVVLDEYEIRSNYQTYWKCVCDCGNIKYVRAAHLKDGKIHSCGCGRGDGARTHGCSTEKLYGIWRSMKSRCYTKTTTQYADYGGRGIKVCEEWQNNYSAFKQWAIGAGYGDGLTLDRKNNDGDYSPENCRWATRKQQVNNRRNNIYITIENETKTLKEWCDILNKDYSLVYRQYKKSPSSFEVVVKDVTGAIGQNA